MAIFGAVALGHVSLALAQQAPAAKAADGFDISGDMRLRVETIAGQARVGANSSETWTSLRTRLHLGWRHGPIQIVTELHDARGRGADAGTPLTTSDVNAVEPVQAYVQADLGDMLGAGSKTTLQAGRFAMALGSRRLVANDDYRNATSAFTGIRADMAAPGGYSATLFYVLPLLRLPDDGPGLRANRVELDRESFDTVLWGGFFARQRKGSPLLAEAAFLHLGERDSPGRPTRDRSLDTASLRLIADPRTEHFDWGLEGIYQWGHTSASAAPGAARLAVSASFVRAHAGYSFAGAWKPRVLFEFDRASGDGTGPGYGRFDTLFGMRRSDLAPAGIYGELVRSNLMSPGVRLEVNPSKRFDAFLGYRALFLADRHDAFANTGVRDPSGNSGSFAGHQFDLRLRYWLVPKVLRAEFDGVWLAKGRFLKTAPNAPAGGDTRYASFNLSASF